MSTSAAQNGRRVRPTESPTSHHEPPVAARRAVSAIFLINGTLGAGWATRIPAIQQHLHLGPRALGLALLGAAIGALVAMNLAGYLAARWGSSVVTLTAGLLFCASVPLLALAPSLPALVGALVFFGAATGSMDVAMNTQGVAVERRYGRPILTSFHAFFSLGGLTGAFLSGMASGHGVQPLPQFLGMAVLSAGGLLVASRFLLPAAADAGGSKVAFAFPTGALLILGLIGFCSVLGEGAIADWSAIYLLHSVGTGAALAAGGYAAFSLLMAAGRFAGDGLTARFGPVIMVRLGASMAAAGLSLALLVQWTPAALLGFGLVGAGFSAIFPIVLSAAGRAQGMASGNAIAAVATCGYVGYLIGPPSIGFIAQAASLRAALAVVVILSLVAAALAPVVRPRG